MDEMREGDETEERTDTAAEGSDDTEGNVRLGRRLSEEGTEDDAEGHKSRRGFTMSETGDEDDAEGHTSTRRRS
jgi:hypothetical protein